MERAMKQLREHAEEHEHRPHIGDDVSEQKRAEVDAAAKEILEQERGTEVERGQWHTVVNVGGCGFGWVGLGSYFVVPVSTASCFPYR